MLPPTYARLQAPYCQVQHHGQALDVGAGLAEVAAGTGLVVEYEAARAVAPAD